MLLTHDSIYSIDTEISFLNVYENINMVPHYASLDYQNSKYILELYPHGMYQEDIEEFCELISTKMNNPKIFGEIYDLMYEEEAILKMYFNN